VCLIILGLVCSLEEVCVLSFSEEEEEAAEQQQFEREFFQLVEN
jgi:hypothetical protein